MRPPFISGFLGAATNEAAEWFTNQAKKYDLKSFCVPFTGSGKVIAMMADQLDEPLIDSWDTQIIVNCFVNGIFAADVAYSNIVVPSYRKGVIYNERPFYKIPDKCAGLIDYIGEYGTLFDRACIASATGRNTMRGRMGQWSDDKDEKDLWRTFLRFKEKHAEYIHLPAIFHHTMGDFYKSLPAITYPYDCLYLDPPKIVTNSDAYSKTFDPINRALGGDVPFDRWVHTDYIDRMKAILDGVEWGHLLFMYTTDVRPDWKVLRYVLSEYGEVLAEQDFPHKARRDLAIHIRRK